MLKIDTTYLRSLMKNTPLSMSMRDQLSVEKSISDCLNREFLLRRAVHLACCVISTSIIRYVLSLSLSCIHVKKTCASVQRPPILTMINGTQTLALKMRRWRSVWGIVWPWQFRLSCRYHLVIWGRLAPLLLVLK